MKVIHTETQEQFDRVLEIFESKGWEWPSGRKPTEGKDRWEECKENTCIRYENYSGYSRLEYYKQNGYTIISFEEFLKEEGQFTITPGELVGVNDNSQEEADEDFRDDADQYYIGKNREGLYVTEDDDGLIEAWKYISNKKLKEKTIETIKIKTEDGQMLSITKEKAIELGFNIK